MITVKSREELRKLLEKHRAESKVVGFVPTMGALHEGHISLIGISRQHSDLTVCSIFVNPTQFNDKADLERYPRMPVKDALMLEKAGCDILFLPEVSEVYPEKDTRIFDFGHLDKVLEGAHRPGHFNGVAQVVSRLFDIVRPDKAFFGSKDYQQLLIINELVKMLGLKTEIVACPTLREKDGLAMSSRNMLLGSEERKAASLLPELMQEGKVLFKKGVPIEEIREFVKAELAKDPIYRLDYYEICDASTLLPLNSLSANVKSISLIACFVGKIRLIDNLALD
jgi:pantoate--beta-alanine ligase